MALPPLPCSPSQGCAGSETSVRTLMRVVLHPRGPQRGSCCHTGTATPLGWGIAEHRWGCREEGGSALLTVSGVAALAPPFEAESPSEAERPQPVPVPSTIVTILGSSCPGSRCSWGSHPPAELGAARSSSCAALAVLSPVRTRNLSYLQAAYTTPGGLAVEIFGCTVMVEQGYAFIGNSCCY